MRSKFDTHKKTKRQNDKIQSDKKTKGPKRQKDFVGFSQECWHCPWEIQLPFISLLPSINCELKIIIRKELCWLNWNLCSYEGLQKVQLTHWTNGQKEGKVSWSSNINADHVFERCRHFQSFRSGKIFTRVSEISSARTLLATDQPMILVRDSEKVFERLAIAIAKGPFLQAAESRWRQKRWRQRMMTAVNNTIKHNKHETANEKAKQNQQAITRHLKTTTTTTKGS